MDSPPRAPPDRPPYEGVPLTGDPALSMTDDAAPLPAEGPAPAWSEDEARWVKLLVARDEAAFHALVRAHERRVFALIVRMIGSRAEAEDLAQEVFVQVFKAIGTFRGESKLSTWIFRIAINLTKNRTKYLTARRSSRQDPLEKLDLEPADARPAAGAAHRPDEVAAGKQLEQIVQDAIVKLEPTFRECLVLRDVEDMSYEEIVAITGLPEGTVKSRLHRARAQLKELVESALGEKIT
jgi:RNA polymerase sigma-70 factor (ECF subfamily)